MVKREVNYGDAKDNPYASNQPHIDFTQSQPPVPEQPVAQPPVAAQPVQPQNPQEVVPQQPVQGQVPQQPIVQNQAQPPVQPQIQPLEQPVYQGQVQNTAPVQTAPVGAPVNPGVPPAQPMMPAQNPADEEKKKSKIHWVAGISVMFVVIAVFIFIVGLLLSTTNEGNLALDARVPDLELVAGNSYFDTVNETAYIQVSRGPDGVNLYRMELVIHIGETQFTEKMESIPEDAVKNYSFDLSKALTEEGVLPGKVTISPVYYVDAIESLGEVVSEIELEVR